MCFVCSSENHHLFKGVSSIPSYQAVMSDFIMSKELESKPLGIITCIQIVASWAKPWQWQLHWRMCLLHPFYKNNRTHPGVVLNTLFSYQILSLCWQPQSMRIDTCRSPSRSSSRHSFAWRGEGRGSSGKELLVENH